MKPFWILFPFSLKIDFSRVTFEQIEGKGCGIGISTKGVGKLNGTVSSNRESSWYRKNTVQFLTDCLFEMVSGRREQMSVRLKIPTLLIC